MSTITLEVKYRTDMSKGRAHAIRRQGWATGSVSGHSAEPVAVEVNVRDLAERVKASPAGLKSLIELKIADAPVPSDGVAIVKGITKDPVTRKTLDIQFQRVRMQERINIGVPLLLVGDSPGAAKGGIVEQSLDELQITCLPEKIPPRIEVDVSGLDVGRHISVSDLHVADDITILSDPEAIVVACVAHRTPSGKAA